MREGSKKKTSNSDKKRTLLFSEVIGSIPSAVAKRIGYTKKNVRKKKSQNHTDQERKALFSQVMVSVASAAAQRDANAKEKNCKKVRPRPTNTKNLEASFSRSKRSVTGRFDLVEGVLPSPSPSAVAIKKLSIADQVANAAVARNHLLPDPAAHRRECVVSDLMDRLSTNDPGLISLKLYKRPDKYYEDFSIFIRSIKGNKMITSVELSWIFLAPLTESQRILLMEQLGLLPGITELQLEGIGPSTALVAALKGCRTKLKGMRIGSLRIRNNEDVKKLAVEIQKNRSLQRVFLSNIRLRVEGRYRMRDEGVVQFEEINDQENSDSLPKMDPILNALATIPSLTKIDLQLQLDGDKMARIEDKTIQTLCNSTQYLILHSCNLDDQHCSAIFQELESNDTIELISLAQNQKITAAGWDTIAKMLQINYSLRHLHTTADETFCSARYTHPVHVSEATVPSHICRTKMDFYLKLNRAGRGKLLLDAECDSQKGWTDFIIREKDELELVFYALVMNPNLCLV